jgi:Cu(I)-responsive transcriptional regulator
MNAAALAWPVNIGMASRMSGVTPKMIRHYEALGLLPVVGRTEGGYRQYSEADVHTLRFIKRSRELGFPVADIGELVSLWRNRRRASGSVKRIAQEHAQELAQRIVAMQAMQRTLDQLIYCCQGGDRPECPILDDLAGLHDGAHA